MAKKGQAQPRTMSDIQTALLEVPLAAVPPDVYLPQHVDVQLNTQDQRMALKRLQLALESKPTRLASGRLVTSGNDTFRWLLEQIAAAF